MYTFSTKTEQFAWKNLQVVIMGRLITGVSDIEYGPSKVLAAIFGAGDTPQLIGEGNKSYEGNLELLQNEYEALVEEAKNKVVETIPIWKLTLI